MEESAKCSLPSISSLLGIADNSPSQQQQQNRPMSQHMVKNSLDLNSEREGVPSAESCRVHMPFTQPQYGLPSLYVMTPALQNMNNYYPPIVGTPHLSDGVNHQQPLLNVGLPPLDAR
ncbi:hypothetical protein V493_00697 [Pseudogymnoascus sp. VKM F-4281 (FW-2241)]|nr:hypothetical protein V493_00697 [Pseudogymnoascus sp. VKM F-4281 (FW-2241)]